MLFIVEFFRHKQSYLLTDLEQKLMIFVLVNLVNQNTDLLSSVKIWKIQEDLTKSNILKAFCQSLFLESCITFLKTFERYDQNYVPASIIL